MDLCAGSDDSLLRAPTLRLSPNMGRDASEEFPDSQVSSGWHGKAIAYWNSVEKAEAEEKRKRDAIHYKTASAPKLRV